MADTLRACGRCGRKRQSRKESTFCKDCRDADPNFEKNRVRAVH